MAEHSTIEWTARRAAISELTERECAYLAGLIDGEGSIYVMKHSGRDGRSTFYPAISVMMTHEGVLQWVGRKLSLAVAEVPRTPEGWRDQHSVRLHGKRAVELCRRLLPYLIVKRGQAELLLSFPFEVRKGRPRTGRFLSEEIVAERAQLRDRVNALNVRGAQ